MLAYTQIYIYIVIVLSCKYKYILPLLFFSIVGGI